MYSICTCILLVERVHLQGGEYGGTGKGIMIMRKIYTEPKL